MRKIIFITLALLSTAAMAQSEKRAKIEFEKKIEVIKISKFEFVTHSKIFNFDFFHCAAGS